MQKLHLDVISCSPLICKTKKRKTKKCKNSHALFFISIRRNFFFYFSDIFSAKLT
jgi:hypothetical protein